MSQTDTINTTLLRHIKEQELLLEKFICYEDGIAIISNMQRVEGTSAYPHKKKELVSRLNAAGVSCTMQTDVEQLKKYVYKLPTSVEMEKKFVGILYDLYRNAKTPAQQIEELVRRFGEPEFQDSSVRLAIVKQYLLTTTYHTGVITEMIINRNSLKTAPKPDVRTLARLADESLFDVLEKKLTKDEKTKYTLLRLADDLANGRFKANGSTKTMLYMFAFAFNMTAAIYAENEPEDYDRDIETNLFFKYYANSVLRYASEDYNSRTSNYEAEPTGDGINYKNYAEVIYLYYLTKQDMTADKRLRRANKAIAECTRYLEAHKGEELTADDKFMTKQEKYTYLYKDLYLVKIAGLSEEELIPFICSHYQIGDAETSLARISVNSKLKTAEFHYKRLNKKGGEGKANQRVKKDVYEGIIYELTEGYEQGFISVLKNMCRMIFEADTSDKVIGRRHLFAAVYNKIMGDEKAASLSLLELSRKVREMINPILEDSRLQPYSENNIFDIFVVILLYRNLKW